MSSPTGEQYVIASHGYRAVVTQTGVLRQLRHDGRELVDGFADDAVPAAGRGQLLVPWPNRIRDGRYAFGGTTHQLALTEPKRGNASHGLVRWVSWSLVRHDPAVVELRYFLPAQTGYPWALDLRTTFEVDAGGLRVTQEATNLGGTPAPYASGAHPYLAVGSTVLIANMYQGVREVDFTSGTGVIVDTYNAFHDADEIAVSGNLIAIGGGTCGLTIFGTCGGPTDLNCDGSVNAADLSLFLSQWGSTTSSADFNHDGIVNAADLSELLSTWG